MPRRASEQSIKLLQVLGPVFEDEETEEGRAEILAAGSKLETTAPGRIAFLDWVSRETGLQIRLEDSSITADAVTVILHGSVERICPDEAPRAVLPTCGLRHRVQDGSLNIMRANKTAR